MSQSPAERYAALCWEDPDAFVELLEDEFMDEAILRTLHVAIEYSFSIDEELRRKTDEALLVLRNQLTHLIIKRVEE